MSLDQQQVEHLAKLARIELTSEEKAKFSQDLSGILDYVEMLKKFPAKNVKGINNRQSTGALRPDVAVSLTDKQIKELKRLVPETEANLVKVKPIFRN